MKLWKRIISVFLMLTMVFTMLPVFALAEGTEQPAQEETLTQEQPPQEETVTEDQTPQEEVTKTEDEQEPVDEESENVQTEELLEESEEEFLSLELVEGLTDLAAAPMLLSADMHLSEAGKQFIKKNEGCVLTAYWDVNAYSIGYGHHGSDVYSGMTITQAQADAYFESDIVRFENAVNTMADENGVTLNQYQFDALTDFTYNEGAGVFVGHDRTIERYLRNGWTNYSETEWVEAFCLFDVGNSGLQARHTRQGKLFYSGNYGSVTENTSSRAAAPAAPTNFNATYLTDATAKLSWTAVSGATSYKVEYLNHKSTPSWEKDGSYVSGTSYTSTGLSGYSEWKFRVCAVNSSGTSAWTELTYNRTVKPVLSITNPSLPSKVEANSSFRLEGIISTSSGVITSVKASILSGGTAIMSCSDSPNTTTYDIHGKINDTFTFRSLAEGNYIYVVEATAVNNGLSTTTELINQSFTVGNPSSPTAPPVADSGNISDRISDLYTKLGNKYFTTDQQSAGSSDSTCKNSNVIASDWFKNLFGISNLSTSQFPESARCTAVGWSCAGFATFAEWYVFRESNSASVSTNTLTKMAFNHENVSKNAKIGDIISLTGQCYNSDGSKRDKQAGHDCIFIKADPTNGIYVLDCNWGNSCKVTEHWIGYYYCDNFQIARAKNYDTIEGGHTHSWGNPYFEAAHPHKYARRCTSCGEYYYTGDTLSYYESCTSCNPPIESFTFDVNGVLDGEDVGNVAGYGTFDVYINGVKVEDDVRDHFETYPAGTTYEIKDIKVVDGHTYAGLDPASVPLSGTINADTRVWLVFNTIPPTISCTQKLALDIAGKEAPRQDRITFVYSGYAPNGYDLTLSVEDGDLLSAEFDEKEDAVIVTGLKGNGITNVNINLVDSVTNAVLATAQCMVGVIDSGHSCDSDSYTIAVAPTLTTPGRLEGKCTCGITLEVYLPCLNKEDYSYEIITNPSFTQEGTGRYTWNITTLGIFSVDVTIPKPDNSGICGNNLTWLLDEDGTLTISGTGTMANYSVGNYAPWYRYAAQIQKVVIETGATSVGNTAFYNLSNLAQVELPNTILTIGEWAFHKCPRLSEIVLPDSVVTIQNYAFQESGLTKVTLSNSLQSIGDQVFMECRAFANPIIIPASVTNIGRSAFSYSAISELRFLGNAPTFHTSALTYNTFTCYYPEGNTTWTSANMKDYGGHVTWIAESAGAKPVEIQPTIPGATQAGISVSAPEGGWKEGTNTFIVSCEKPCVVAVSYDGGQTYVRLLASDAANGKSFTAENMTADTKLAVVVKGDASGDGVLTNSDAVSAKAASLGKKNATALQQLAMDVNGDGILTNSDMVKMKAASLGKTTLNW